MRLLALMAQQNQENEENIIFLHDSFRKEQDPSGEKAFSPGFYIDPYT